MDTSVDIRADKVALMFPSLIPRGRDCRPLAPSVNDFDYFSTFLQIFTPLTLAALKNKLASINRNMQNILKGGKLRTSSSKFV